MLLDDLANCVDTSRPKSIVGCQFYPRFQPELGFTPGMLHVYVRARLLPGEEVEPVAADTQNSRAHASRISDLLSCSTSCRTIIRLQRSASTVRCQHPPVDAGIYIWMPAGICGQMLGPPPRGIYGKMLGPSSDGGSRAIWSSKPSAVARSYCNSHTCRSRFHIPPGGTALPGFTMLCSSAAAPPVGWGTNLDRWACRRTSRHVSRLVARISPPRCGERERLDLRALTKRLDPPHRWSRRAGSPGRWQRRPRS